MRITVSLLDRILAHAAVAYPAECCGLLLGQGDRVQSVAAARNLYAGARCDRFEIDPLDHVRIWEEARASGHSVIGCYHSHPDGQAYPSSIDRQLARRFGGPFGYLIVGIQRGGDCEVYAGLIGDDGCISPVTLELESM